MPKSIAHTVKRGSTLRENTSSQWYAAVDAARKIAPAMGACAKNRRKPGSIDLKVVLIVHSANGMRQPRGLAASAAPSCWRLSLLVVLGFDQFPVVAVATFVRGPAAVPVLLVLDI